jgi:hypothetical protein
MASPFSIFRKNQRAMMAVVMILCMIAFLISGVASSMMSRGSVGASDAVVATTIGGPIRESDLQRMLDARRMANRFMAECMIVAYGQQQAYYLFAFRNMSLEQQFGPDTEEAVVQTAILADRAKRMGIVISNRAVEEFLRRRTSDKVTANQYVSIVNNRLGRSQPEIFDALRTELAAIRLGEIAFSSVQVTPAQRWDYYRRLNQQAETEVVAIDVADFIDDVSEPTEDELRTFFEKHKETEPNPNSPEHGFKVPKKAAFRYFVAKYEQFAAEAEVSDEEIKKFYEENKAKRFRFTDFGDPSEFETAPGTTPHGDTPTDETGDSRPDSEDAEPASQSNDAGDGAAEKPIPDQSDSDAQDVPGPESQSSRPTDLGVQLALYAVQDDELDSSGAVDEPKTAEADATDTGPNESSEQETPAEEAPERTKTTRPSAKNATKEPPPPPITSKLLLIRDIRQGPKPEFDPLWKVEASIRKELADQRAVAKMNEELHTVQKEYSRYRRNMNDEEDQESAELDFAALAKEHGLKTRRTELLARYELEQKYPDLAGASLDQEDRLAPARRFVDVAYLMPMNQSNVMHDLAGNRYLFWKTDEKEAYVPEFDEVRDEALRAWKLDKAREVALKRAESLADEANDAHKSLAALFGKRSGLKVHDTGRFTWLSVNPMDIMHQGRSAPQLSDVDGVDSPGNEFMRVVFNLEVNGVGAALNHPQTVAYVVRVKSLSPSLTILHTIFMSQSYDRYAQAGVDDAWETVKVWREGIAREAQLVWKRPPDQPHARTAMK